MISATLATSSPLRRTSARAAWGWLALAALASPAVAWLGAQTLPLALQPVGVTAWFWALILAPVLEEVVFRPLLQQGLQMQGERLRPPWRTHTGRAAQALARHWHPAAVANGLTALAFAAAHAPAHGWLAVWWVIPSLALGETWRRTGRLWPCVLLHSWFNLSLVLAS